MTQPANNLPNPTTSSSAPPAPSANPLAIVSLIAGLVAIGSFAATIAMAGTPVIAGSLTAIAQAVLGWLILPSGLVAIITGHLGLHRSGRVPGASATRVVALAGLVIGYAVLALTLALVIYIAFFFRLNLHFVY
jgi:hypothetical protein